MRQPHQILAFPYKKDKEGNYLYGIFARADKENVWQAIAGGVEEKETFKNACRREAFEEAGIRHDSKIIELESTTTIPVVNITGEFTWGEDTYLVWEHSFGIEVKEEQIKLSSEHKTMKWLLYEDAMELLTWDSNKNALWELNYKLTHNKI